MDQPSPPGSTFGAVIALKPTEQAKSRLGSLPDPLRRRLAWAMALDTLRVVTAVAARVVVVSDQPGLAAALRCYDLYPQVIAESGRAGLNAALTDGAEHLQALGSPSVFACVGDLPALSDSSLRRVLATAARFPRSYLADATGVGTTMLFSTAGPLDPRFQGASANAHLSSGAVPLSDDLLGLPVPDARRDVDSQTDLFEAFHLGIGGATGSLFDPNSESLGRYRSVTVAGETGHDHLAITADGYRIELSRAAIDPPLRRLNTGQRLHAVTSADRVLSAWL